MIRLVRKKFQRTSLWVFCLIIIASCDNSSEHYDAETATATSAFECDADNGGLTLPPGFCAGVIADSLGFIRHLTVNERGDIYVALRNTRLGLGGIMALRDSDEDGRMDQIEKFTDIPGLEIQLHDGSLYFASETAIFRYELTNESLLPEPNPEKVVGDFPEQNLHAGKAFAIDNMNNIYVNVGSISNACQEEEQVAGSPGLDPCPELDNHAGIWRFSLDRMNQVPGQDGEHYAIGIRNTYAIDWHPVYDKLYAVQHGRDQLHELWPDIYSAEQGAQLPAEEFLEINDSLSYGWPYCYYDQRLEKRVLAPEYGGNGILTGRCENYPEPLVAFPGHYGPNDMVFYTATQFPGHYQNGAFIAFHGSYNRGPFEQVGYQIVFVPFANGTVSGTWEVFADGFAGDGHVRFPEDAEYRPTGVAVGPDGSLYVTDSVQGRVWRIIYRNSEAPSRQ